MNYYGKKVELKKGQIMYEVHYEDDKELYVQRHSGICDSLPEANEKATAWVDENMVNGDIRHVRIHFYKKDKRYNRGIALLYSKKCRKEPVVDEKEEVEAPSVKWLARNESGVIGGQAETLELAKESSYGIVDDYMGGVATVAYKNSKGVTLSVNCKLSVNGEWYEVYSVV